MIVLDSVKSLCCRLPPETADRETGCEPAQHYFDMLPFLAKQGYRVLIPEWVMFRLGKSIADGDNINRFFPHEDHEDRFGARLHDMQKFCEGVVQGKYPGISVIAGTEPEEVATSLDRYHRFCRANKESSPQSNRSIQRMQKADKELGDELHKQDREHNIQSLDAILGNEALQRGNVFVITENKKLHLHWQCDTPKPLSAI